MMFISVLVIVFIIVLFVPQNMNVKQREQVKRVNGFKIKEGLEVVCPGIEVEVRRPPKHVDASFTIINPKIPECFKDIYPDIEAVLKQFDLYWIPISKVETSGIYTNVWYERCVYTDVITYVHNKVWWEKHWILRWFFVKVSPILRWYTEGNEKHRLVF